MINRDAASCATFAAKYGGSMLTICENPHFPLSPRAKEYEEQLRAMPEKERNAYLFGEWACPLPSLTE